MERSLPFQQIKEIDFRMAQSEDAEAIFSLLEHLGYPMTACQVHQALNIALRDPSIHVLLAATTGASIIGLITMRCFPVLHLGGYQVSIDELVVAPEYRGHGIGSWLLEYAFGYSRQKNVVRVEVHSNITRESISTLSFRGVTPQA